MRPSDRVKGKSWAGAPRRRRQRRGPEVGRVPPGGWAPPAGTRPPQAVGRRKGRPPQTHRQGARLQAHAGTFDGEIGQAVTGERRPPRAAEPDAPPEPFSPGGGHAEREHGVEEEVSDRGGAAQGDRREERDEETVSSAVSKGFSKAQMDAPKVGVAGIGVELVAVVQPGRGPPAFSGAAAARPVFPLGRQRARRVRAAAPPSRNTAPMSCR